MFAEITVALSPSGIGFVLGVTAACWQFIARVEIGRIVNDDVGFGNNGYPVSNGE